MTFTFDNVFKLHILVLRKKLRIDVIDFDFLWKIYQLRILNSSFTSPKI